MQEDHNIARAFGQLPFNRPRRVAGGVQSEVSGPAAEAGSPFPAPNEVVPGGTTLPANQVAASPRGSSQNFFVGVGPVQIANGDHSPYRLVVATSSGFFAVEDSAGQLDIYRGGRQQIIRSSEAFAFWSRSGDSDPRPAGSTVVRTAGPMNPLPVYFLDTVITTGNTIRATCSALGWGTGLAYADAISPFNRRLAKTTADAHIPLPPTKKTALGGTTLPANRAAASPRGSSRRFPAREGYATTAKPPAVRADLLVPAPCL